jgi:hypothetical protein
MMVYAMKHLKKMWKVCVHHIRIIKEIVRHKISFVKNLLEKVSKALDPCICLCSLSKTTNNSKSGRFSKRIKIKIISKRITMKTCFIVG